MNNPGLLGTRIDRYEIQRLLGSGGFGAVYLARHVHTEALVALKLLRKSVSADPQIVERFLREAKAAAAVGVESIVRVSDAGSADGQAFLAMEYLDGCDLKELAAREGPLAHQRIVNLMLQVLEGLEAAHQRGIVHRDMKPANVFIIRRSDELGQDRELVKLLDFGISKMHGESGTAGLTMTGMAMGTPSYMAPEQFFDARNVDGRADLYSVAVMLYELLSNRLPFDADSYAALVVKVKTEPPPPLLQVAPQVPASLAQVVMSGLAKEKEKRWSSAFEFANALRAAMGLPPKGHTPTRQPASATPQPIRTISEGDTPSMLLGQTATPMPAAGVSAPAAPAPQLTSNQRSGAPQGWVGPSQSTPGPTHATGQGFQVSQNPGISPPKKNNVWTVVIIVSVLLGGLGLCCVGSIVFAGIQAEQDKAAQAEDDEVIQPGGAQEHIDAMKAAQEELKARGAAPEAPNPQQQAIDAMKAAQEDLKARAPTDEGDAPEPAADPQ